MDARVKKYLPWALCALLLSGCCVGVPVIGGLGWWAASRKEQPEKAGAGAAVKAGAAPSANGACTSCLSPVHIDGLETMTVLQKAAIDRRCPACGHRFNCAEAEAAKQMLASGADPWRVEAPK
jgi:hypothetical protein